MTEKLVGYEAQALSKERKCERERKWLGGIGGAERLHEKGRERGREDEKESDNFLIERERDGQNVTLSERVMEQERCKCVLL